MEESALVLQLVYHIQEARLGRRRLAAMIGSTEMRVRAELDRMRDRGLIELDRNGASLTRLGCQQFASLLGFTRAVTPLDLTTLRIDTVALAAHLAPVDAGPVWSLRDAAVRIGATGLLLLRFHAERWCFAHNAEPIALRNPEDAALLASTFPNPRAADILLIVSGPDLATAGIGLWHTIPVLLTFHS